MKTVYKKTVIAFFLSLFCLSVAQAQDYFSGQCPNCLTFKDKVTDAKDDVEKTEKKLEPLEKQLKNFEKDYSKKMAEHDLLEKDYYSYTNGSVAVTDGVKNSVLSRMKLATAEAKEISRKIEEVKEKILPLNNALTVYNSIVEDRKKEYNACLEYCKKKNGGKNTTTSVSIGLGFINSFEDSKPSFSTNGFQLMPHILVLKNFAAVASVALLLGNNSGVKYNKTVFLAGGYWYPLGPNQKIAPQVNIGLGSTTLKSTYGSSSVSNSSFTYNAGVGASIPVSNNNGFSIRLFANAGVMGTNFYSTAQTNFTIDAGLKFGFGK